jgi:hypothetical protein
VTSAFGVKRTFRKLKRCANFMRVLEIHGPSAWRGFSRVAEDLFGSMSLGGLTCSVFTVCTARAPYLFRDANVAEPNVRHNRAVLRPSRTSEQDQEANLSKFQQLLEDKLANVAAVLAKCFTVWVIGDLRPKGQTTITGETLNQFARAIAMRRQARRKNRRWDCDMPHSPRSRHEGDLDGDLMRLVAIPRELFASIR